MVFRWRRSSSSAAVVIGLIDLNAALILGLWTIRTIVVYVVIAFFVTLLLTPATRLLKRLGLSHGLSVLVVFLVGLLAFGGLVYLFAEPLVTSAVHFGKEVPALVKATRQGRGPLGRLVYRLHLQKYLSQGSTDITKNVTKVLKPATALSVGAAAVSTLVAVVTIAVLTFFTHARGATVCGAGSCTCSARRPPSGSTASSTKPSGRSPGTCSATR